MGTNRSRPVHVSDAGRDQRKNQRRSEDHRAHLRTGRIILRVGVWLTTCGVIALFPALAEALTKW